MKISILAVFSLAHAVTANWAESIWDDVKHAVNCAGCETVLFALKGVADLGEHAFQTVLTDVCDISGTEDKDVCSGLIAAESPALYYNIKNLGVKSHTSKVLCAQLFGLCQFPAVRPYNLTFPSPKPTTSRPPPSGQSPIRVAHISDTHVDLSYETGSNYECSKPICCRVYTDEDAPGNTSFPCGPYGNTNCDPPLRLEESMMAAIKSLNPAFSIYTGDVVAHDLWMVDKTEVLDDFNATYSMLDQLDLVYAAVGNHDTTPVNLFPSTQLPDKDNQWAYDALTAEWKSLTNSSIQTTEYGSYSAIYENLRIISYNSIFYYQDNFYAYTDPMAHDPSNQLTWLIDQLHEAESANQRVWLISHIPTGGVDHLHDYSHYIDEIVQRYEATISALFFGHTHTDLFQIAYSDYKNRAWDTASAIGYVAPSLTPTSGPPAFRIYDIDPVTFAVLDYTVYIANISNPSYQSNPKWEKYYSAKEAYGSLLSPPVTDSSSELTPSFWHNVTALMEKDDSVFQDWWSRTTRGYNVTTCTGDCAKKEICALRGADAQYNCVTATPGFHFDKREESEQKPRPECEDGLGRVLGDMIHKKDFVDLLHERTAQYQHR
ncbi:hypothetical protein ASPWEDRAFT_167228 [Aspergillus wentii DTO 134E9]|uniref:Sphingomyelin phosphodiesterase n=1 Tax=Aspergillus wentii DTO 134E9 TaxID=1073089 RepID=A0A1L9S205_ASPWE|nr:uncharacterized protein ASPWEDRAFT_167228 [Aspergillus wentii DTO 134E9]OJJ41197.1 hypothetical protein ASPWEDRAFT_167228 [Aspergillus wentii DTO 134E9]